MSSDFHFLVPESFHKKVVQIGTAVSEKIRFEFVYIHDLGPRSRNDIDLQYLHTFIYSIRCLFLLIQELNGTKTYKETSTEDKTLVNCHSNDLPYIKVCCKC